MAAIFSVLNHQELPYEMGNQVKFVLGPFRNIYP